MKGNKMKVLVACENSGTVREAFKARGHIAWSVDLLPSDNPEDHCRYCLLALQLPVWVVHLVPLLREGNELHSLLAKKSTKARQQGNKLAGPCSKVSPPI